MAKRIAIIGAGGSGLSAIKCCLDERLQPVCYEQSDDIGGLWNYHEHIDKDRACVMKTTISNACKETSCYTDFLFPKEFPNYMHNTKVNEYLGLYADEFGLRKFIKFNTKVLIVKRSSDYEDTGRWEILHKDPDSGQDINTIYDGVMLCTGINAYPKMPTFPGEAYFKGKLLHSHEYRHHKGFEDKNVVVVGMGQTGPDIACELSKISKQVFLSTHKGSWVLQKRGWNGIPLEQSMHLRLKQKLMSYLPFTWSNSIAEREVNSHFDHALYGVKPKHRISCEQVTINDDLANSILNGTVRIKPNIKRITETGVEFDDGTFVDDIDAIIYATGYRIECPYLEKGVILIDNNKVELFKYVYPPNLKHHTLAAIGIITPIGGAFPVVEMQSRWAARVFKGDVHLPNPRIMFEEIAKVRKMIIMRNTISTQVDWLPYMDDMAQQFAKLL